MANSTLYSEKVRSGEISSVLSRFRVYITLGLTYTGLYVGCTAGEYVQVKERDTMEENVVVNVLRPQPQQPGLDLDDLIFAGEGWMASDR
jgi:hypothetical protein